MTTRYRIVTNGETFRVQESSPRWTLFGLGVGTEWLNVWQDGVAGQRGYYPVFATAAEARTFIDLRRESEEARHKAALERAVKARYDTVVRDQ